jgi:putative MATE family efflux protein
MLDLRYRSILAVALPLMASSFIQSVVMITDSAFLSRYSTVDFDAAGNGGLLYITFFVVLMGLNDGSQILMARRIGQRNLSALPGLFGTTLFSNFMIGTVLFLVFQFIAPDVIRGYSAHQEVASAEISFLHIRSFALFFGMVTLTINAYFMAMGKTFLVMCNAIVVAVSNIVLDSLLIFGQAGFPEMGIEGAALASTIADGLGMLFMSFALYFHPSRKDTALFSSMKLRWTGVKELLKLSSPMMLQGIAALATWTVFFAWIEQMGLHELTVSQTIRSLYFLAFIPVWGFASTTKTYISQYIGKGDFDALKIIMRRIQLLTLVFLVAFFHGALLYPETLIHLINPEAAFMEDSAEILRFVSGSVLIFGLSSVYFQTINGSGNTRYTFFVELASVIVYLIASYLLIKVYAVDIYWVWSVEYIYFISMGGLSILYLRYFNWHKKVI